MGDSCVKLKREYGQKGLGKSNMKAAIIGAGSEALHTIQKAREYGLNIVAFDGNPNAEGLAVADKSLVVDIFAFNSP